MSKIFIYFSSILYALIIALPFIIVLAGIYFSGSIDYIQNNTFLLFLISLFALIGVLSIFIAFSFNYILLTKLNLEYLNGNKLKLGENYYFNFKMFFAYYKTFLLNFLIIFTPIIIAGIIIIILIILFGGVESARVISDSGFLNGFTISSLIIIIIAFLLFIYLTYKTLFSIIILVDESNGEKFETPLYYIKKSFNITNGFNKAFRFILVFLLVLIVSAPITVTLDYFSSYNTRVANYVKMKVDPSYTEQNIDFYYAESLTSEFGNMDLEALVVKLEKGKNYRLILEILNFLLIYGLFEMMLLSFYRRELKNNIEEKNIDKKTEDKKEEAKNVQKKSIKKEEVKKIEDKKEEAKNVQKKSIKKEVVKKTEDKKEEAKNVQKKSIKKEVVKKIENKNKEVKKTPAKKRDKPRKIKK